MCSDFAVTSLQGHIEETKGMDTRTAQMIKRMHDERAKALKGQK